MAPRTESGEIPAPGEVRLQATPIFQAWHREFGPGPDGGEAVPAADDWSGPVLDQIHPGPGAVLEELNDDADALGFEPVAPADASAGTLEMREVAAEVRSVAFRLEVGILDGLSADAMVPLVRTEVEPFGSFDPSGATLASADRIFDAPSAFFSAVSSARGQLRSRLESGEITGEDARRARELLQASGAFAGALQDRVEAEAPVPLGGSTAGTQLLSHYGSLRDGFASFGLSLPQLSLPQSATDALLSLLSADPFAPSVRGWLAGEAEFGLRLKVHDGFAPAGEERTGLEARTTLGARARLPFRSANATPFVDPTDPVGLPLGDGQRDFELSVYQDLRWRGTLVVNALARYGLQQADVLRVLVRSPDRPFATPSSRRRVERDLGDYLRVRVAPRLILNRFLSMGAEYRYWHKGRDRFRALDDEGAAAPLELETGATRHRLGLGAHYRPDPPEEGERAGSVPALSFVWQTALAGSGGEVPAANLVTFRLRIPFRPF